MKQQTSIRSPGSLCRWTRLLAGLIAVAGMLAVATDSGANQVYKSCGRKWLKQAQKLPAEQLSWMLEARSTELTKDLDGDGVADTLIMTNTPSYRNCDPGSSWDKKETTIRIEYGNGKAQVFYWINSQRVERIIFYGGVGRFLVAGVDFQGEESSRWVEYRRVENPMPQSALAKIQPSAEPAERLRIASLQ